jgi:uncharacterized protein (DUF58 family)
MAETNNKGSDAAKKLQDRKNQERIPDSVVFAKKDLEFFVRSRVGKLLEVFRFILKYKMQQSGLEFFGLRKYYPTDDASKIDWKTSVRQSMAAGSMKIDKLYIKQFEEYLDLTTFCLVDTSNSMMFGSKNMLKSDLAGSIATTMAFAATEARTIIGAAVFNDTIKDIVPSAAGELQTTKVMNLMTDKKNYGGKCNLGQAIKNVTALLPQKSIVIIVSDFTDIQDDWKSALKNAIGVFDTVIGVMVRDPLDSHIPKDLGTVRLATPFLDNHIEVNFDRIRDKYNEQAAKEEDEIRQVFESSGAGFIKLYTTDEDPIKPFRSFFSLWASKRG